MNTTPSNPWTLARRAERMNPSVIREILKVTEKPGIISFGGGLPSARTFPVAEFAAACAKVLRDDAPAALQYASSEGYRPLVEMVADRLPWKVDPSQVLITTGSQQGLDLVAKVLADAGSRVLVETPTYLGALQAFAPMEPEIVSVVSDEHGVDVDDLQRQWRPDTRFLYVLPKNLNLTTRGTVGQIDQFEQAALARPGGPGQKMETARLQIKTNIAQNLRRSPIAQPHVTKTDDRGINIGDGGIYHGTRRRCWTEGQKSATSVDDPLERPIRLP